MKITIACVGKLKEKYLTAAMDEYVKRLQPFCKLEIVSINEEKMPQEPSEAEREQVLEKETKRLGLQDSTCLCSGERIPVRIGARSHFP